MPENLIWQLLLQIAMLCITGVAGWLGGKIRGSKEERERREIQQQEERDMNRRIFRLLLRYRLKDLHEHYVLGGRTCPVEVKQGIQEVYELYHALGGNGQGTHMYKELMELHVA